MKKLEQAKKSVEIKSREHSADFTSPDINNDKSESDDDADKTVKRKKSWKSRLGDDPDSTGIDTKADKTKKEKVPNPEKIKIKKIKDFIDPF